MIINIKDKAAYYHAPKCASRTILGWIALIENPNLIQEHPEYFKSSSKEGYHGIRNLLSLYPNTPHYWHQNPVPIVSSNYRFCVIRNPIERFISGFINRAIFLKSVSLASGDIDLETFIDKFDYIESNSVDIYHHFMPQYYFYGELDKFHCVYKMNEIYNLKEYLEKTFNITLPNLHLNTNGDIKKPFLNDDQKNWIRNKYAIDYQKYGHLFNNE